MGWTDEQARAIAHERGSALVSAAAGSGKTTVLTERILRLVESGARMEQFLVVTFTQAAAREMKARLQQGLLRWLDTGGAKRDLATQALGEMGSAQISTLHAFCRQVLARHFQAAGLDSAFTVLGSQECAVLRLDTAEALFEAMYEEGGADFLALDALFGGEDTLKSAMLRLYDAMVARPDPEVFLTQCTGMYHGNESLEPVLRQLLDGAAATLEEAVRGLRTARSRISDPRALCVLDDMLSRLRALLDTALRKGYAEFYAHLHQLETPRWPRGIEDADAEWAKERLGDARDALKALKDAFNKPLEDETRRLQAMAPYMDALIALVRRFESAFAEAKAAQSCIDYADMEHMALKVLREDDIAKEYRERFEYIFVDEYQDSNDMQEALLEAVSRGGNLFLVGDVKQSIYRFRLADPTLFVDKALRFAENDAPGAGVRIDLTHNFRSTSAVVNAVNTVFSQIMTKALGDMDYDESAALTATREGPAEPVELLIVNGHEDEAPKEDAAETHSALEKEARAAAKRVQTLHASGFGYGDIAVLMRVTKQTAGVFAREFANAGIPALAESAGGYFEAREVMSVLQLLRVIDNRRQDIPLLAVMRVFFDFTLDELVALRTANEGLYEDVLTRASGTADDALSVKCRRLIETLALWKQYAQNMRVDELVFTLLEETGYAVRVGALPNGETRRANLRALCERAQAYAQGPGRTLDGFLCFLERMREAGEDFGEAAAGAVDAVRILSVHRSKGLEFPAVILSLLGRKFKRDTDAMAVHKSLGVGLPYADIPSRVKGETVLRRAIRERAYREGLSEELRILYVGMTRAKDKLILLGSVNGDLTEKLSTLTLSSARCPMDWLLKAFSNHVAFRGALSGNECEADGLLVRFLGGPSGALSPRVDWRAWAQDASNCIDALPGAVIESLAWTYPYANPANVPSKLAAARLGHADALSSPEELAPGAGQTRGLVAHAALQWLDLRLPLDERGILEQAGRWVEAGKFSREQYDLLDAGLLAKFFRSELGKALLASEDVRRELRFQLAVPASRVAAGAPGDVLLQGVIDCCFQDGGEWILLDYKTDRVAGSAFEAAAPYFAQVNAYREALNALSGRRVKAAYVVLLRTGEAVLVPKTE